jgi:hypothetical protein
MGTVPPDGAVSGTTAMICRYPDTKPGNELADTICEA